MTWYLKALALFGMLVAIISVNPLATVSLSGLARVRSIYEKVTLSGFESAVRNLGSQYRKKCPEHRFTSVKILSRTPDLMIIDGFLTDVEAEFLVRAA